MEGRVVDLEQFWHDRPLGADLGSNLERLASVEINQASEVGFEPQTIASMQTCSLGMEADRA